MTPIYWSRPMLSMMTRLSTTFPLAMRSSAMPHTCTRSLVGGMPALHQNSLLHQTGSLL